MPRINVPELPGIVGLFAFKPSLSTPLKAFIQELLRGPSSLTPGEREMIAALVSTRNECRFCSHAHAAAAVHAMGGDRDTVACVIQDIDTAPVSEKMKALLRIAAKVQESGLAVTDGDIATARHAGAEDEDIHDTVMVAAAFSMFNRYVDGLAATTPTEPAVYDMIGKMLAEHGYGFS